MKNFHENNAPKSKTVAKLTAVVSPFNKPSIATKPNKQSTLNKSNTIKKLIRNNNYKMDQSKDLKESQSVSSNDKLSKPANTEFCAVEKPLEELDKSMPTVIVSPKSPESQQRPSVIRSVPKLLPYRVLPSNTRFSMLTNEGNCGKSPSDLMPPPGLKKMCDKPKRNSTPKQKVPKDDALNRCFRIIQHTSSAQHSTINCCSTKKTVHDMNAVVDKPVDKLPEEKTNNNSGISDPNLLLTHALDQGMCGRLSSDELPFSPSHVDNNCTLSSKCLGGPTLPTSLPEVLEASDTNPVGGDGFSYIPLGESSCSTYTPYFESDCFRGGENNCYEDFDMGFQYIS